MIKKAKRHKEYLKFFDILCFEQKPKIIFVGFHNGF